MEVRAGYKKTEIGVIPDDWEVKKLGEILQSTQLGGNYPNTEIETNSPLIKMGNLVRGYIDLSKLEYITNTHKPYNRDKLCYGDVIFNTRNTLDLVGKVAIWRNELPCAFFNSNIMRLKFKEKYVDSNFYMNYIFNTKKILSQLRNIATGTTSVAAIYTRDLLTIQISLPSLPEQKAIAKLLSDTDNLMQALEKRIAKKRQIKQGTMQKLLTPKDDWEVKKLGDVFNISAGGDLIKDAYSLIKDEKHPYPIYSNALTNKGLYGFTKIYRHEENCITVTARGMVGAANERNHKFDAIGRVLILRPISAISCFFMSEFINHKIEFSIESTGVPQLTAPQISKYEIKFPNKKEQIRIATILSDMNTEIETLEKKLAKYKQLKQGLMQNLLTGKIRLV